MRVTNRTLLLAAIVCAGLLSHACALESKGRGRSGTGGIGGGIAGVGGIGGGVAGVGGGPPIFFDAGTDASFGSCGFCPPPPMSPASSFLTPCCTDDARCGFSTNGLLFNECQDISSPGFPSTLCPTSTGTIGPTLEGCCLSNGMCGLSLATLGLGCIERRHVTNSAFVSLGNDPVDIACFGELPDAGSNQDAGEVDSGFGECTEFQRANCDPVATCSLGSTPRCRCPAGYADLSPTGQGGFSCRDINECLGPAACSAGQCVNTPGSFRCDLE